MKKILFILLAVICSATMFAQEKIENTPAYLWKYQGQYYTGKTLLTKQMHLNLLKNTCPEAYAQYKQGTILKNTGWSLMAACPVLILCVGVPALQADPHLPPYNYTIDPHVYGNGGKEVIRDEVYWQRQRTFHAKRAAFWSMFGIGCASFVASIPLISVGYAKRNQSIETYNLQCAPKEPAVTYSLTAGQNGLGIAINF